ncbi:MAG: transcriptional regulator [Thermodesulfobacteriota bacterium]
MSRGRQLTRQWRILQRLCVSPLGVTIDELAGDVECCRRTLYRDLNALEEAGFPLYNPGTSGKKNCWAMLAPDRQDLPLPLELPEVMALYLGRDVLKILKGTFIYDNLDALFKKIQAMLPAEAMAFLKEVENNLYVRERPYKHYRKTLVSLFDALNRAIADHRAMYITYFTMSRGEDTRRRIDPYSMWYFDGSFYVIGYCHSRKDIRVFAVDRIKAFRVSAETFQRPEKFSGGEFMKTSFGVFQGKPTRVRIRFSAAVAGYVREKKWHESQVLTDNPDGSVDLEMEVAGIREIKLWILGWGAQAEVLFPEALRKEIRAEIRAMKARYK